MAEEGRPGQAAMCDVDSKMARLSVQDAELSPHCRGPAAALRPVCHLTSLLTSASTSL